MYFIGVFWRLLPPNVCKRGLIGCRFSENLGLVKFYGISNDHDRSIFPLVALSQKKLCQFSSHLSTEDDIIANILCGWRDNFHVGSKSLTGFALAIWEKAALALYFEGSKIEFLKVKYDLKPLRCHRNHIFKII